MDQRITAITLGVKSLKKSRAFYRKLGWTPTSFNDEHVAFFQLNGMALALFSIGALVKDAGVKKAGTGFNNMSLACNVRSKAAVRKALAQAKKAGAKILKPCADAFWGGYTGYFADPDGHAWEVAWNPFWPLDKKGNIKLPK